MAKRLHDTEKWERPWFRKLPTKYKSLWDLMLSKCDVSGVWYADFDLANFMIGDSVSREEAIKYFEKQVEIKGDRWLIKDFIEFQYGQLDETNKMFKPVTLKLNEFKDGAYMEHISPIDGVKDKVKDKDKDTIHSSITTKQQKFQKPSPEEITEYAKSIGFELDGHKFFDHYEKGGWVYGRSHIPIKNWKAAVRTWKSNGYGGNNHGRRNFDQSSDETGSKFDGIVKKVSV